MTLVFFGTSEYCLPVLTALKNNFALKLIITRPDKPVGRKKILTPSATKLWAQKHDLPVTTPLTLKKDTPDRKLLKLRLESIAPDLAIVADYGQIIPEEIFILPRLGTINIHFSKLPDLRGASPVQSTLLRGDTAAWITIFKIEKTLDTGPILDQRSFPILPDDTAQSLYIHLFTEVANYLPDLITSLAANHLSLVPQSGTPTFCQTLTRDDGFIKWEELRKAVQSPESRVQSSESTNYSELVSTPNSIYNRFRAYYPWPGIWTIIPSKVEGPRRVKILQCHLLENRLILDQIQFEGKKPQDSNLPL